MIGSSDTHNAGGPVEEDHYFGKTGMNDGTPEARRAVNWPGEEKLKGANATPFYRWSAAGLAGVWAERNNREDIFAAFRRKETFATSGPRIKVRLFAGFNYPSGIFARSDFAKLAYGQGVPMGGNLALVGRGSPTFLAQAIKDANSAGLQRIQIIRGWSEGGQLKEAVYDIACAAGTPDAKRIAAPQSRRMSIPKPAASIPVPVRLNSRWHGATPISIRYAVHSIMCASSKILLAAGRLMRRTCWVSLFARTCR